MLTRNLPSKNDYYQNDYTLYKNLLRINNKWKSFKLNVLKRNTKEYIRVVELCNKKKKIDNNFNTCKKILVTAILKLETEFMRLPAENQVNMNFKIY